MSQMYPEQEHEALGEHYIKHVDAMTAEGLHSKSDIAAQLAWRDREIEVLRASVHESKQAEDRYFKLRSGHWSTSKETLVVVRSRDVQLGAMTYTGERLDNALDAMPAT